MKDTDYDHTLYGNMDNAVMQLDMAAMKLAVDCGERNNLDDRAIVALYNYLILQAIELLTHGHLKMVAEIVKPKVKP